MNAFFGLKLLILFLSLVIKQVDHGIAVEKIGDCHHCPQSDTIHHHYKVSTEFFASWKLSVLEKSQYSEYEEAIKEF